MIAALVAVFILSGAAGLIYESLWSRYLGLFVGHSAYAQIIVLVIFLGGMSLGAHLVGNRSARVRSPLLWYAVVEFVVGILALAFHDVFRSTTGWAYTSVFPALGGTSLIVVKWLLASALILPQSILLGTTFPLMSAGVIRLARANESPGHLLGLLYFANSIGAAIGVLVAGFFLIARYGLPGTLMIAGFINVVVGLVVGLMVRAHERHARAPAAAPENAAPASVEPVPLAALTPDWRPLLLVSFGTAVASFIYEIAWIRMLSLVLGSATHSFELMLSAFILGLALGALWVRSRIDRIEDPVRFLGIVQWVMGGLAIATLPLYIASFGWMSAVIQTVEQNEAGYRAFQFARYLFALLVMLPATFCAGMTLPLITRVLMRGGAGERAIGVVYAVNTLGSIIGVVLAGLILMPLLGLKLLLVFGAVIDIALGIWLVARAGNRETPRVGAHAERPAAAYWSESRRPSLLIPVVVTAAAIALVTIALRFDLVRLTSGVYRHGILERLNSYTIPFYKDGRTATVSVRRGLDGFVTLATNGKPDASMEREWMDTSSALGVERRDLRRDIATQLLLPIISLAHAPDAANVAVIGHGSGMSSHVLLGSPKVREVVTIEIEPEMIKASRVFRPANARVFDDPRSKFVIDDAKSYFAASGRKFDLILSEPSNPWVSGVAGLFTREFYQRVRLQLAEGGVFGQWLHLYELNDGLVTAVIAAIDEVFPSYEVFFTSNADVLIVAANQALRDPSWSVVEYRGIAQDLRRVVPIGAESFEALRLGGREVLHPIVLSEGASNSDFFPVLDLGAERMRFMRESANGYMSLAEGRFDVVAALTGRRQGFGTITFTATPEVDRPLALSLGAKLRAVQSLPPDVLAQMPREKDLRAALFRLDGLNRLVAASSPPADWHEFIRSVVEVDRDVHSGTAGVVDTALFARLRGYVSRAGGPLEARASIDFLEGIGAWNWPRAAVASKTLIASTDTVQWIPDVLLRNGAAVSYIMLRDTTGAKDVLRTFAKRTFEDRFRETLIASYLVYSDTTLRKRRGWQ